MTQLRTGEVDMWPIVGIGFYDRVKALPNTTTIAQPGYLYEHLDFNMTRPIFADRAVREALRYAIDRATLRRKIWHGLGVLQEGMVPPISPLYSALPRIPFDLAKANALLDADGWKRGADGVRVKNGRRLAFDFAANSGQPDTDQGIELIRSTWGQLGAQLNLLHYPPTLFFGSYQDGGTIYAGKFDVIDFSWGLTPDGDLSNLLECDQVPPNGQNDMRYCSAAADAIMRRMKVTYGDAERRTLVAALQRQVIADVPTIVMSIREDVFSYISDLARWHPNNTTPFDDMLDVVI